MAFSVVVIFERRLSPDGGGALGGAIVSLYQNGSCDEQRDEQIDTSRYGCSGVEG